MSAFIQWFVTKLSHKNTLKTNKNIVSDIITWYITKWAWNQLSKVVTTYCIIK